MSYICDECGTTDKEFLCQNCVSEKELKAAETAKEESYLKGIEGCNEEKFNEGHQIGYAEGYAKAKEELEAVKININHENQN